MWGGSRLLAILGAMLAAIVGAFFQGHRAGRVRERAAAQEQAHRRWREADEIIRTSQKARRDAGHRAGDELLSDDGFKRPGD